METNHQIVITKENLSDYTDIRDNINVITDMRFEKEGKTWVGCSRTEKNAKIIVCLNTSSYKGIVAGAKHYFEFILDKDDFVLEIDNDSFY